MRNKALLKFISLLLSAYVFAPLNSMAQKKIEDSELHGKLFTLEDLNYGGNNYHNMVPENRHTTWWGDELVHQEAELCALVDKTNGKEITLFTLEDINSLIDNEKQSQIHHLYNCEFPYPKRTIVKLINGKELLLIDWKKKELVKKYNRDNVQAEEWNAKSKAFAFVKENQLFVNDGKEERQLTTDGSREIVYGQAVHRNEFGIEKGLFWSPNGQRLAFYRMDQSMVADYPQINIEARIAQYEPDKYPMAGEASHQVTIGIYDLKSGKTLYLQTGQPVDRYFTNISWSPDSKTIYTFELNRDQNDCQLVSYDATTGEKQKELYHETHPKYVEPQHPITFVPWDDTKFIMQSQKDGYNHLYLFNRDGNHLKKLTSGNWVVMYVIGFNKDQNSIIILSNEKSPIQANLYSVSLLNGHRFLLDNGRGYHSGELSTNGTFLLDRYSEPNVPKMIDILSINTSRSFNYLTAANPWKDYNIPIFESGTIKANDGITDLYYRMVKPADFNPAKKYPTVVYVYGGPHAHNVDARWHYGSRSWETYMAQKGYILFILDNRGSENRGREFEQVTFRQLGQIEMQDQMKGIDFLRSLSFVDTTRIGIHGWSFGGFMTISLMTNYPDVFKVGVAGGPVIDWNWYEVMYGERYMDTPQQNPEGYKKTSLINKAKDLKGKLQIITGYNDSTVVPQHCLSFLAACIEAGTQPDFFVYPGEPHNMRGHQSVHLHERITQYFEDYLK
ncbi:MAG: DPP IV N-terminal domain-containing protein [Prevotella sp.]|nr:DPP IV N-terminal domain-containing protein [Prevotella sp.]